MIASGLCVMGGCFALENGAAVETYWPAAAAVFSPEVQKNCVALLSLPIYGGDTRQEFCVFKGVFQHKTGFGSRVYCAGLLMESNSMAGAACVFAQAEAAYDPAGLYGAFGLSHCGYVDSSEPVEFSFYALNNSCRVEVTGGKVFNKNGYGIAFGDDRKRNVVIRSAVTISFHGFEYGSELIGVRFCINAMKSVGGASALFTDYDATLVEV